MNAPDGCIPILGHSQVQELSACLVSPFGVAFGYGAMSSRRLVHHMARAAFKNMLQRAGAGVIFCPGCNDASNTGYYGSYAGSVSTVVYIFQTLLKPWLTGKWVIVLPLPGDQRVSGFPSAYNQTMRDMGTGIKAAYAGMANVAIVDPFELGKAWTLTDATGNLRADFHNGDGQHLSKAGDAAISAGVKAALEGLGVGG